MDRQPVTRGAARLAAAWRSRTVMLGTAHASPAIVRGHLSWLSFMRMTLDPFIAVVSYVIVMWSYSERFEGKDLILCLIVFSLMFPGDVSLTRARAGLARSILANWILVVAILFFFGWATTYLVYFYTDALRSWAITVPIAIYIAHRLIP